MRADGFLPDSGCDLRGCCGMAWAPTRSGRRTGSCSAVGRDGPDTDRIVVRVNGFTSYAAASGPRPAQTRGRTRGSRPPRYRWRPSAPGLDAASPSAAVRAPTDRSAGRARGRPPHLRRFQARGLALVAPRTISWGLRRRTWQTAVVRVSHQGLVRSHPWVRRTLSTSSPSRGRVSSGRGDVSFCPVSMTIRIGVCGREAGRSAAWWVSLAGRGVRAVRAVTAGRGGCRCAGCGDRRG